MQNDFNLNTLKFMIAHLAIQNSIGKSVKMMAAAAFSILFAIKMLMHNTNRSTALRILIERKYRIKFNADFEAIRNRHAKVIQCISFGMFIPLIFSCVFGDLQNVLIMEKLSNKLFTFGECVRMPRELFNFL